VLAQEMFALMSLSGAHQILELELGLKTGSQNKPGGI